MRQMWKIWLLTLYSFRMLTPFFREGQRPLSRSLDHVWWWMMMMTFFGTRFLGSYAFDFHQIWYAYSLYEFPGRFVLIFFQKSSAFSFNCVSIDFMGLGKISSTGHSLVQDFSVPVHPNCTKIGINVPCMNIQASFFIVRYSSVFAFHSVVIDFRDWDKFRVQSAPGGYTFYVGLRSNFAYVLFMVSIYYYKKKLN